MSIVSNRLKIVRTDSGLTQPEIAEKLGITLRTYQSYERGERDISTSVLKSICELLGVSSDYLLGRVNLLDFTLEPPEQTAQRAWEMMEGVEGFTPAQEEKSPRRAPTYEDAIKFFEDKDMSEEEFKELQMFAEFLRYRRGRQP